MGHMTMKLIDIGANLTHPAFAHDLSVVLDRAFATHVVQMIATGTDVLSIQQGIELNAMHPQRIFTTVGLHPHNSKDFSDAIGAELMQLAHSPAVVAIGETGLDFNRNYSPPAQQEKVFEWLLELAVARNLPLFLHERDAHDRFFDIVHHYREQLHNVVVHCFTGDRRALFRYLDLDLYIGITGWVCDERRGYDLHPLLPSIPNNRLMIETDAPYLFPRGVIVPPGVNQQRNEPCMLPFILEEVARHQKKPAQEVSQNLIATTRAFFDLPDISMAD